LNLRIKQWNTTMLFKLSLVTEGVNEQAFIALHSTDVKLQHKICAEQEN
jgi:hypothetical protein